ncbi:MAG: hypothetical protein WCP68_01045 [Enhydrobacter sp.]
MHFGIVLFIGFVFLITLLGLPTVLIYRRNHGRLSWKASYYRAFFHFIRVFGWIFLGLNLAIFFPLWLTDRLGLSHFGFQWWGIFFIAGCVTLGYGLQRFGKFLLQDEDIKNILGRGEQ